MKLDPNGQYTMPAHFGQTFTRGQPKYPDVLTMQVSYVTDRALLAQYLPTPFEVGKEAVMSVSYSMNREIEWLAGGSYNIVGVNAATVFNGSVDQLSGNYCLVMWENLTDPILAGREIQGIPKIYGDIEDHRIVEGIWRTSVSHRGH